jgi:hypothetical protein
MTDYLTFPEFLRNRAHSFEVDDRLMPAIEDLDVVDLEDPNNLFAVSPHFLKCCSGEPQEVLEALVVAYNRWILFNLRSMRGPVERCITANRVIFIEDAGTHESQAELWKGLNASLTAMSGCLEDLMVHYNYMSSCRHAAQKGE